MANIIQINGKKVKDVNAARMSSLAPVESSTTASMAHAVGDYFWLNGTLYEATAAITVGNAISVGTNCKITNMGENLADLKSDVAATDKSSFVSADHLTRSYYLDANGAAYSSTYYISTPFIPVKSGDVIKYGLCAASTNAVLCFYTEESASSASTVILGEGTSTLVEGLYTVPSDGYIRFATYKTFDGYYLFFANLQPDYAGDIVAEVERLKNGFIGDYNVPYNPSYNVIAGGITTNGANLTNTARCRTQYFDVSAKTKYFAELTGTTYKFVNGFVYTSDTAGSVYGEAFVLDDNHIMFVTDAAGKARISFAIAANPMQDITSEDMTAIKAALSIYKLTDETLSMENIPADAKTTGVLLNGIQFVPYPWDEFVTSTYTTGWRSGMWSDSGSATSDSSDRSICLSGRIGMDASHNKDWVRMMRIVFPAHTQLVVKRFSYTVSGLLETLIFTNGFALFKINENDRIAITLTGLTPPTSGYLNNTYISQIAGAFCGGFDKAAFKPRESEFTRFTVPINKKWPDVSSTTNADAESDTAQNIKCLVALPTNYATQGKPCPLIMFGHGASCQITDDSWYGNNTNFLAMIRKFTQNGYAVFDVNNTRDDPDGNPDWGCLPLMEAYVKAWQYVRANYNVEDKLYLLSDSMGTAANLMMLKWYSGSIIASIMTAPRPICKERYAAHVAAGNRETAIKMLIAYGLAEESDLSDSTFELPPATVFDAPLYKGYQHHENIITVGNTPILIEQFPPCKVLVGTGDTDFLAEVREYYQALQNAGNFVDYQEVSDANHAQMSFMSIGSLKDEALAFFERFKQ